jgi:hypothetical protein
MTVAGNVAATAGLIFDNSGPNVLTVLGIIQCHWCNYSHRQYYRWQHHRATNLLTGTLTTAAQPNVTSVGTLSSLTVTANVSRWKFQPLVVK